MVVPMTLRLPVELHSALRVAAGRSRRSLHAEVLVLLEAGLGGEEPHGGRGLSASVPAVDPGSGSLGSSSPPSPALDGRESRVGADEPAESRAASRPSSACPMVVPRGVKCKACGSVHK
jgi:hypothetical protein